MAIYSIMVALIVDILLNAHLLTPMFGSTAAGTASTCSAIKYYTTYTYFFEQYWPIIAAMTVSMIPACLMIAFLVGIVVNIHTRRNRLLPTQQTNVQSHEKHRTHFIHRQMLILMLATIVLFFFTTQPVALYRFLSATLKMQPTFSVNLLLTSIFGMITASNYALNFYLHCLTSTLFRKEFIRALPCPTLILLSQAKDSTCKGIGTSTQRNLDRIQQPQRSITHYTGQQSKIMN
jgi:hypothetical protein